MKKVVKILLLCVFMGILSFVFYIYKLHSLSVEGNALFEYRCLHVNPPLIAYKSEFLKYADFLNNYPDTQYTPEDVTGFLDGYIEGMRAYVPEETKWLEMQKKFTERWDFQLIEPWYIKEGSLYQWKMYEAYRDDAVSLLKLVDNPETISDDDLKPGNTSEERQRRDSYSQKYFDFFEKASEIPDWRKHFTSVPVPESCTDENMIIPDTSGSIDWDRDPDSTPSGVPIDPYGLKA